MAYQRFTAVITKEGHWYVAKSIEVEVTSHVECVTLMSRVKD